MQHWRIKCESSRSRSLYSLVLRTVRKNLYITDEREKRTVKLSNIPRGPLVIIPEDKCGKF